MKWIRRVFLALVILACALVGLAFLTVQRTEHPVGFQVAQATDAGGRPFVIGVWYPTEARPWPTPIGPVLMNVARNAPLSGRNLPLVVISHGNGGGPLGHADLALALANAGYIVAAPMHNGDNLADQSALGSPTFFTERTRQLHATVDHMLTHWDGHDRIDPNRIGAFGFSMGGFTVLTAVGAQPDLRTVATHCAAGPEFACDVLRHARSPVLSGYAPSPENAFVPDARIRAAVVAAPGFGFTMAANGYDQVRVPVQLWSAEKDENVTNSALVRDGLGSRAEFHLVPGAGHLSFLTPCGVQGSMLAPGGVCSDAGGFDRKAFHAKMNASVVAFFNKHMKS